MDIGEVISSSTTKTECKERRRLNTPIMNATKKEWKVSDTAM